MSFEILSRKGRFWKNGRLTILGFPPSEWIETPG